MKYYEVGVVEETVKAYGVTDGKLAGRKTFKCDDGVTRSEQKYRIKWIPKSVCKVEDNHVFAPGWIISQNNLWDYIQEEYKDPKSEKQIYRLDTTKAEDVQKLLELGGSYLSTQCKITNEGSIVIFEIL